jgi:hypothetical protein
MLRRIGLGGMLSAGEELPTYYDPHYGCHMQVLQFDSRHPNPKYHAWVAELESDLMGARVVCGKAPQLRESPRSLGRLQSRLPRRFDLTVEPCPIPAPVC